MYIRLAGLITIIPALQKRQQHYVPSEFTEALNHTDLGGGDGDKAAARHGLLLLMVYHNPDANE
jgi:hypothetical protein